ncbi:hypothetical protein COMA2_10062 [Candidatus Nitrospira nitrificans]|uniref:Uncharacterized protein n=1 Tax=Candidatus Nitrospira nitrificans TaxID=1742973 RepID=A0A0S4L182_9BACT|nr:hypothetical protein COMA2_10062 [Candidatus Nitrospira nitrificans]
MLGLMVRLAFLHGQRKEHLTGPAGPDLKIRNAVLIDFGGKKELSGVIAHEYLITELHNGQPVVEGFERRFLPFASEHMPKDKDRLALALDTKFFQRSLGGSGAGELTGGAGSDPRHSITLFQPSRSKFQVVHEPKPKPQT